MRNIRRSVALALAAIMMMAMNMVSFAADTAPAETEAVESVTRSTNGESVLLDKVYFACDGKNTISSREPIPATALDIENRILGSMEYFYDGLDSSGRPQYTVKVSDGTLWEVLTALYFRWTCLPDCAVPELDADYRRNNRRLS